MTIKFVKDIKTNLTEVVATWTTANKISLSFCYATTMKCTLEKNYNCDVSIIDVSTLFEEYRLTIDFYSEADEAAFIVDASSGMY
jgi:hypothetical protein